MINEYMPLNWVSTSIAIYCVSQNVAALLVMFSPFMLPDNNDTVGLRENETWRIIMGLPGVLYALQIVGFYTLHLLDSPSYYVQKGDSSNALKAIHDAYYTDGSDELAEGQLATLESLQAGS